MVGRIGLSTVQNVAPSMDGLYIAARKVGAKVKGKGMKGHTPYHYHHLFLHR